MSLPSTPLPIRFDVISKSISRNVDGTRCGAQRAYDIPSLGGRDVQDLDSGRRLASWLFISLIASLGVVMREYKQQRRSLTTTATPSTSSPPAARGVVPVVPKPTQHRTQHPTTAVTLGLLKNRGWTDGGEGAKSGRDGTARVVVDDDGDGDGDDAAQCRAEEAAANLPFPSLSHSVANFIRGQPGLVAHLPPSTIERRRDRTPSLVECLVAGIQRQVTVEDEDDETEIWRDSAAAQATRTSRGHTSHPTQRAFSPRSTLQTPVPFPPIPTQTQPYSVPIPQHGPAIPPSLSP
ncbi:hypothetical protein PC9H_009028 [Pleurotus ostreatus]|uniref:Uncharacterized protein n=1 Tax=Pleurotus ostreatus TaxID=5322 RepID=A0A8H7DPL7_PLEOS|nr:uncharacterized protein PC9H_009028 [Pleurotus ostreatus]KAF7426659.1 hypothetical protein PC9H_009028 [Pleurotus ostreatus]